MLVSPGENHSRQPKPSDHGHGHGTARPVMRSVLPSLFNSSACDLSTARLPLLGRPNSGKETDNSRGARTDPTSCAQENERERERDGGAVARWLRRQVSSPRSAPSLAGNLDCRHHRYRHPRLRAPSSSESAGAGAPAIATCKSTGEPIFFAGASLRNPRCCLQSFTALQSNSNATTNSARARPLARSLRLSLSRAPSVIGFVFGNTGGKRPV